MINFIVNSKYPKHSKQTYHTYLIKGYVWIAIQTQKFRSKSVFTVQTFVWEFLIKPNSVMIFTVFGLQSESKSF